MGCMYVGGCQGEERWDVCKEGEERWDVCKEGEERTGEGSPCAFVFVYSLIIDESEGVVWAA